MDRSDDAPSDPFPVTGLQPVISTSSVQPLAIAEDAAPPIVSPSSATLSVLDYSEKRVWRSGTLVYTSAGLIILFGWLLFGDFAIAMRDRSIGPVAQLMLKGFGANNFSMSVLLSVIPTAIGMVQGPIVNYKSDRLRSRWGRRIPFLLIPTPIAAISMIGLAFCPNIATRLQWLTGNAMARESALLVTFGFFWTCFEIAAIVAGSVLGGLINDVVPQAVVGRFYGMFRAVPLIDGMIFNWYILSHAELHFTLIFFWIALVYGVGFTLMCLKVKEGTYPPVVDDAGDDRSHGFFEAAAVYFRECFSSAHYRWIFAAFTLAALATNPINKWSLL